MQLKPIDQQVVVLMGASSGIGRLTAHRFARRGARVVVAARNEADLNSLVEEITASGGEALAVPADTTNFAQVQAVADQAVSHFGHLDTWVQLAAVAMYARFDQTTPEEWQQIIDINLNGQAYGAMAALPHLKRTGRGALIHIASVLGERAVPLQSAYSASKHGVVGMADALRVELQQENMPISVTTVRPASINSTFFSKARTKMGVHPAPYPPVYAPELVADGILYAAAYPVRDVYVGDAARVITVANSFAPRTIDGWLQVTGADWQQSNIPKSVDAPDSVFGPIQGYGHVEGDFAAQVVPSLSPWMNPSQEALQDLGQQVFVGVAHLLAALLKGVAQASAQYQDRPPLRSLPDDQDYARYDTAEERTV